MLALIGAVLLIWIMVAALVIACHVLIVFFSEDRSSSASRQHYIDTGRYLTKKQVREEAAAERYSLDERRKAKGW